MAHQTAIEYYNEGLKEAKNKNWDEAIELLNKAIAEDPKHINAYNVLGKVYVNMGEIETARKYWLMALKIDPDNPTANKCLASVGEGRSGFAFNTLIWQIATGVFLIALIISNIIYISRINSLKGELAKARAVQATTMVTPDLPEPVQQPPQESAPIIQADNTIEETPVEYTPQVSESMALETDAQVAEVYDRGLEACRLDKYDEAVEIFHQILGYPRSHPLKANARYWLGECYYAQRKYTQALDEFKKVQQDFPDSDKVFDAELKVAYTYYNLDRLDEAKQKLLQLSKNWQKQYYQDKISILAEKIRTAESDQ
jgi:TolA-binding protein